MASENKNDQSENDEVAKVGEINSSVDEQTQEHRSADSEIWFPDLKDKWREADPLTAPLLSVARIKRQSWQTLTAIGKTDQTSSQVSLMPMGDKKEKESEASETYSQPNAAVRVPKRWFRSEMLAALPFHHLIPAEKLAAAFAAMPPSLFRPQTIGESERRRQLFWQSLAAAGVSAKEAALLDDSLHCQLTDATNGRKIEVDWEVLYYDELQGSSEMYRAEMLAFKRRIYEAGDELRGILELRADEFLGYLNSLNFNINSAADSTTNCNAHAVIDAHRLGRWFMDNLTGSYALTVSEPRNENEKPFENDKTRKTRKMKTAASDYTNYRTYSAKRIESWMFRDVKDNEQIHPNGVASAANVAIKSANTADILPETNQTAETDQTNKIKSEDLSEPTKTPKARTIAEFSTTVSTVVYRLQLADYWLDWQAAARTAKFDFNLLETLTDVRAMRFYELTKLWRLCSTAESGAIISGEKASVSLPDTLEIEYERFVFLMPLPLLHYERQIKEQLRNLIKPLKLSGYVKSFAIKPDWRELTHASRLVFRFSD